VEVPPCGNIPLHLNQRPSWPPSDRNFLARFSWLLTGSPNVSPCANFSTIGVRIALRADSITT
jgi:hypothetical protein